MVSSLAPDGHECAYTRACASDECKCTHASERVRVRMSGQMRPRVSRQSVRFCARLLADAGADMIDGRTPLAASWLYSWAEGKATDIEQSGGHQLVVGTG